MTQKKFIAVLIIGGTITAGPANALLRYENYLVPFAQSVAPTETMVGAQLDGKISRLICTNNSTTPVLFGGKGDTGWPVCSDATACPGGNKIDVQASYVYAKALGSLSIQCTAHVDKPTAECRPQGYVEYDARRIVAADSTAQAAVVNHGAAGSAYDLAQGTGGDQPLYRTAGNCTGGSGACLQFVSNDFMSMAVRQTDTWTKEIFCVDGYFPATTAADYIFAWDEDSTRKTFRHTSGTGVYPYVGTTTSPGWTIALGWHSICLDVTDPTAITGSIDGVTQSVLASTAITADRWQFILGAGNLAGSIAYDGLEIGRFTAYDEDPGKTLNELTACGVTQWAMTPTRSDTKFAMAPRYFGLEDVEQNVVGRSLVAYEVPYESEFSFGFSDPLAVTTSKVGRLTMTPPDAGDFVLAVNLNGVGEVTRPYHVTNVGAASSFTALLVGDSLTAGQTYPDRVATQAGGKITMLGTQGTGNLHEGHSGKTWLWFQSDVASPMTDGSGVLDVSAYLTALGATPDVVVWLLGTNGTLNKTAENIAAQVAAEMAAATALLVGWPESTQHAFALTLPGTTSQAAFTANYGNDRWTDWRVNQQEMVLGILDTFGGRESEGIYLIPTQTAVQPETSWGDYVSSNALHPTAQGYNAVGDSVAAFLLWRFRA